MTGFADVWRSGDTRVMAVRLTGMVGRVTGRNHRSAIWWFALLVLAEWPLLLNVLLMFIAGDLAVNDTASLAWMGGLGIVDAVMLVAATTAWQFVSNRTDLIEELVADPVDRLAIGQWLRRRLALKSQIVVPMVATILSGAFLLLVERDLVRLMQVGLASYLVVCWTSFIGGNVVYWLWTGTGLPKRICVSPSVRLRWHDPGGTPGLRVLADGCALSAVLLLVGTVVISVLTFLLPQTYEIKAISVIFDIFFALCVASAVRVGVLPYVWIWRMSVDHRRTALAVISAQIGDQVPQRLTAQQQEWIEVYSSVANMSPLPFTTNAVIQYGAIFTGAIIAYFVGQFK